MLNVIIVVTNTKFINIGNIKNHAINKKKNIIPINNENFPQFFVGISYLSTFTHLCSANNETIKYLATDQDLV